MTETNEKQMSVSTQDAAALMRILLERGYFRGNTDESITSDDALDTTNTILIERRNDSYITVDKLQQEFQSSLSDHQGRWTIKEAADSLFVSEDTLRKRIVPLLVDDVICIEAVNGEIKEVVTGDYLAEKSKDLQRVLEKKGKISLLDAAESIYDLPSDVALKVVKDLTAATANSPSYSIRLDDHGAKVLVTGQYLDELKESVSQAFLAFDEPVEVATVVKENGWEQAWVQNIIHTDLDLPGEFHGDTYVPKCYTDNQRQSVIDSFHSDGFVTAHMCQNLFGMSSAQMKDCLAQEESSLLILENSVIHPDMIVAPIAVAVQEAIDASTWLDLQQHLPVELLEHETDDARTLVKEFVLLVPSNENDAPGLVCINSDGALLFSKAMIENFTDAHLSILMEDLTKSRAQELFEKEGAKVSAVMEDSPMTGKEKRKARKAKSKRSDTDTTKTVDYGIFPLDVIVNALTDAYPDLPDADTSSSSVLIDICKLAFCNENFESLWESSIRRELERLHSAKKASATKSISQRDVLGDFQSVEAAFEDSGCFANACYMIQAMSKFLLYASESLEDEDVKNDLQIDFLLGCCADFTSRITQYAIFKNDAEDAGISFQPNNQHSGEDEKPLLFYSPVNLAARYFRKIYLSAKPDPQTSKQRDPLPLLREVLPGNVGVSLARQWILCGGECYQGGVKPASEDSGEAYVRPGDVEGFLAHVQENCLTICGLPFTKLDKKSEKRFLNARRQCLMDSLEGASDAGAVLDLSIMLLYQLVKNMVVAGPLLRGPILQLLIKERKISEATSKELCGLAESLEKGAVIDSSLLERIKACGLSKQKS